jgi:DUF971 family protein
MSGAVFSKIAGAAAAQRTPNEMSNPWPTELRLHKDRKSLAVTFDNGEGFELAAEYPRVGSPSAEVQGHSPSERRTVAGKRDVQILEAHPVGNYAVRLSAFDRDLQLGLSLRAWPQPRRVLARVSRRTQSQEPFTCAGRTHNQTVGLSSGCRASRAGKGSSSVFPSQENGAVAGRCRSRTVSNRKALPAAEDGEFHYEIRSAVEDHNRVARESELTRA